MDDSVIEARLRACGVSRAAWNLTLPGMGLQQLRNYVLSKDCSSGIAYLYPSQSGDTHYDRTLMSLEVFAKECVLSGSKVFVLDFMELYNYLIGDKEWVFGDSDIQTLTSMLVVRDFASTGRNLPVEDYGFVVSWLLRRNANGVGLALCGDSPIEALAQSFPATVRFRLFREIVKFPVDTHNE